MEQSDMRKFYEIEDDVSVTIYGYTSTGWGLTLSTQCTITLRLYVIMAVVSVSDKRWKNGVYFFGAIGKPTLIDRIDVYM